MFETEVEKSAKLILPRANTNIFTWYAVKKGKYHTMTRLLMLLKME